MTISASSTGIRRKRSGRVALTTMAALGGGALLSGCGEAAAGQTKAPFEVAGKENGQEVELYENVFACAKQTGKTREECTAIRNEAIATAEQEAPRFEAQLDCEQQFGEGKCMESTAEQSSSGRSHFSPFIAAFILGAKSDRSVPAFSSPGGGFQTSRGVRLGYAGNPGKYYAASRAFQPLRSIPKVKPASAVAKKAGFGETSRKGWMVASYSGANADAKDGGNKGKSKGG